MPRRTTTALTLATLPGRKFMRALWGISLGEQPADAKRKAALRGRA